MLGRGCVWEGVGAGGAGGGGGGAVILRSSRYTQAKNNMYIPHFHQIH